MIRTGFEFIKTKGKFARYIVLFEFAVPPLQHGLRFNTLSS